MSEPLALPLLLLYTDESKAIEGATRFQKLVFLAQEETDLETIYSFRADRYGPFSAQLASDLDRLVEHGYVTRDIQTNELGKPREIYGLTTAGLQKARDLVRTQVRKPALDLVQDIKREYNNTPIQDLLRYVYHNYEDYVTATDLDVDALFDPDTKTEFETLPPADQKPETVGESLTPTPHTLWQLPKRETNAYFYYFTDAQFTESDSKYKHLDNALTLLGRNRAQLEVAIIDRDRTKPELWDALVGGFDIDDYPALVVAEKELGVRDLDLTADAFDPSDGTYAMIESGIIEDRILDDPDEIREFLNALFDGARESEIERQMQTQKVKQGISIAAEKVEQFIIS
ncbi:hypothetical protein [Halorhabdus rudnickae]|uniref:hypothetical protein n=1 Tax=Halorhabdus rudnickae TaxID=1775544 RepID=UPI001083187C|nr:hypothetical protein [Halorhabdus rudnickae]